MLKKTTALSAASFTGVIMVVELIARALAPSLPVDPGMWPRIEIAQKLDQLRRYVNNDVAIDVVFAGSSMMAGGVDPVAFNRGSQATSYNAAFAGPSIRTVAPWVTDIVVPLTEPDAVVLGIQSRELNDRGPKHAVMYEKFITSPGYDRASSSIAGRFLGTLEEASYFLRYRRAFREPDELFAADGSEALAAAEVRHELGPFGSRLDAPGSYHTTKRFMEALYSKTLKDMHVGGREMDALRGMADSLKDDGIRLILLNMPVTEDYWSAHADPEGEREAYLAAVEAFVDRSGVTLIDAEDAFAHSTWFRDPMHLDVAGRSLMGEALARAWSSLEPGGSYLIECETRCEVRSAPPPWERSATG